jgi:hypothetical protein
MPKLIVTRAPGSKYRSGRYVFQQNFLQKRVVFGRMDRFTAAFAASPRLRSAQFFIHYFQ